VQELKARGIWDPDRPKKELEAVLAQSLKGAQRVLSLLITDPEYTILDCEPLNDLKGHLKHLLTELPYILKWRAIRALPGAASEPLAIKERRWFYWC